MSELSTFQKVLQDRALRYGAVLALKPTTDVGTFVGCKANGTILGFPVAVVVGLAPFVHFTPIGGLRFVRGLTHLRGNVMAVVDVFEQMTGRLTRAGRWILVIDAGRSRVAVPIEEFLEARLVGSADLLPVEKAPELPPGISSMTHDLWLLLDAPALENLVEAGRAGKPEPPAGETRGKPTLPAERS